MQVERTRLYRVKTVAAALDVSAATIYRAVESGVLRAVRLGKGKGAVRIPGDALSAYLTSCEEAAVTRRADYGTTRAAQELLVELGGGA